ncbi:MAG: preprotein translocase subunit SecE [Clostridia bacterium]|nr:preprotein translocase subunit SecE [Clostridia bacterium]
MAEKTEKKANIFKRMGSRIAKFWRDFRSEMKKVVWMSGTELRKNSVLVIISVIVFTLVLGLVDFSLSWAINKLGSLV